MNRLPIVLTLVLWASLGLALCCCGGSGGPPSSSDPTVGGGLADGPGSTPGSFEPPAPNVPTATTLAGWAFGVRNDTTSDIVAYAWWETRDNVPPPFPGQRWYNLVPLGDGVNPGETQMLPPGDTGRPWYEPAFDTWIVVRAYLRDGRVIEGRIFYAPPTSAVWVVRS